MNIENFLSSVEVFSKLDHETLQMLSGYVEIENFDKDDVIIEQGVQGLYLWVIYQGSVKVFQEITDKAKVVLATLSPPDIFGEISLITKKHTTAEVKADEPSVVLRIPKEVVSFVLNKNLVTNAFFSRTFVERLTDSAKKLARKG